MIGCLRTRVRNQPIIALYFEAETVLKFYNLKARIWKTVNVPISEVPKPWEVHDWLENGDQLWCDLAMVLPEL